MPFYEDGSTEGSIIIHVGWLDAKRPFTRGDVDPEFVVKLSRHYRHRVRQTRGFQICPLCPDAPVGLPAEIDGETIRLGSAEVQVHDSRGVFSQLLI